MNGTTRKHYSKSLIANIQTATQRVEMKPSGLWYSVEGPSGDHWKEWCEAEEFNALGPHVYTLDIDLNRILLIQGEREFDSFDRKYSTPYPYGILLQHECHRMRFIDWLRVAIDFDGIEIVPYLWSRRMSVFWYYGWDCASGCIWHPRAVTSFAVEVSP